MGEKKKIMIADDSRVAAHLLTEIIESIEGCEVVGNAVTGEQAIEYYEKYKPDLVTMDLSMPGMGGTEVHERLTALRPGVKVILSSGYSDDERVSDILANGARVLLRKPYTADAVLRAVREVLDGVSGLPGLAG